jgi:ketosteroid isomerase-like protein
LCDIIILVVIAKRYLMNRLRLRLLTVSILIVTCTAGAPAGFAPDMSGVMKPVNAVIAAVKSDDPAALSALYSSDAVVVDDQQPYEWTGASAGSQWLADVSDWTKWSRRVATLISSPANILIDNNERAYVVLAARFSSADPKKPWNHDGTVTFTLRKVDGAWKIRSQVWAQNFHPQ